MNNIKTTAILFAAASLLAACSSTPLPPPATPPAAQTAPTAPPATPETKSAVAPVVVPDHLNPNSAISKDRIVYFDFDDYAVKPQYSAMLERHSKYLTANAKLAIKVAGNADERGSSEYNLALGQKRADAVVRAMKLYGAKYAQLEAVSWGKEKPVALGHDEESWAKNRRAELDYPTK
jgi:peptidoglycan-associated lipoprotein